MSKILPMRAKQCAIWISVVVIFLFLVIRQHQFVDRHAVDVLYWDSWDLYQPLFDRSGWWSSFALQHGPHRQGLGGLLMRSLAEPSRWNARWDAFSVSFTLMLAAIAGIWLAFRCGVRGWALVWVPFIYLNLRQCHMFIAAANPAHGALPVLLLTLYCLALFMKSNAQRLGMLSTLTFLMIFTGFGIFAGLITPLLIIFELVHVVRSDQSDRRRIAYLIVGLIAVATSWTAFGRGYRLDSSVPGITFSGWAPAQYLGFIGAMFGNFFGLGRATLLAVIAGVFLFFCLIGICLWHIARLLKLGTDGQSRNSVVFVLSAYALLFCSQAAVGRVVVGWQTGAASRYVTLMIPMAMALLIHLSITPTLIRLRLPLIFGCVLVLGTATLAQSEIDGAWQMHDTCMAWESAELRTHDRVAADRLSGISIYPGDITERLRYLEKMKLNLFDPSRSHAEHR